MNNFFSSLIKFSLFVLAITNSVNCFSQGYKLERFTTKDGLLDESLYKVALDSSGRLVIFSELGICIYTGKDFIKHEYPEGTFTMGSNILLTKNLNISIAEVKGILEFKNNTFYYERFIDSLFEMKNDPEINSHGYPLLDKFNNLYFWCNYLYYYSDKKFSAVNPKLFKGSYYQHSIDNENNLYLIKPDSFYFVEKGIIKEAVRTPTIIPKSYVQSFNFKNDKYFIFSPRGKSVNRNVTFYDQVSKNLKIIKTFKGFNYSFTNYNRNVYLFANNLLEIIQKGNIIKSLKIDSTLNVQKIMGHLNDSMVCFEGKEEIIVYNIYSGKAEEVISFPLRNTKINSSVKDGEGNLWIATNNGVYKLSQSVDRIYAGNEFANEFGQLFFVDHKNNRYYFKKISKDKELREISKYDLQSNKFYKLGTLTGEIIFNLEIGDSIILGKTFHEVINTEFGPMHTDCFRNSFGLIHKDKLSEFALKEITFIDTVCSNSSVLFERILSKKQSRMTNSVVNYDNKLWVFSSVGPIAFGKTNKIYAIRKNSNGSSSRLYKKEGSLYYSTDKVLFKYDKTKDIFLKDFELPKSYHSNESTGTIIKFSSDAYLYIDSLISYDSKYIKHFSSSGKLTFHSVQALIKQDKFDLEGFFTFNNKIYIQFVKIGLYEIKSDAKGFIMEKIPGLLSNDINRTVRKQENLVCMTKKGVSIFNASGIFNYKDIYEGLSMEDWSTEGTFENNGFNSGNNFYFPKHNSFIKLDPSFSRRNNVVNKVRIQSIIINNTETFSIDSLKTTHLSLPYKSQLTFNFYSSCLTDGNKVSYRYNIPQIDTSWTEQKEGILKFISLSPGVYTLKIVACNNDRVWLKEPEEFSFEILSPWYRTYLAYLGYFVLLLVSVYAFIKSRTKKLEKEKIRLEKIVVERTTEVVEEKKLVELRNKEIEEKQKEILDSIRYAKRIQSSLLPTEKYIDRILKDKNKKTKS